MIAITLNFISIEAARAALLEISTSHLVGGSEPETKAEAKKPVKAATSTVAASSPTPAAAQESAPTTVTAEVKEGPKPAATPATQPAAGTAQTTSSETPSASVDYPTLQKAVFALAGKSRDAAAAVATSMGVKTFKELPETKWGEALVAVNAAIADLVAEAA